MGKVLNIKDAPPITRVQQGRKGNILVGKEMGATKIGVMLHIFEPNMTQKHYHYHKKRDQVYIVLEGSGAYQLEDKELQLTPNTVVFIKPGEKHGVKGTGSKGLKMLEINSDILEPDMYDVE